MENRVMNLRPLTFALVLSAAAAGSACGQPPAPPPASPSPAASAKPAPAPSATAAGQVIPAATLTGDVSRTNPGFAKFPAAYANGAQYARTETVDAFIKMADAAKTDGVSLRVVSGFRSFSDQKRIWENKWNGKTLVGGKKLNESVPDPRARALKILEYSSMPTTSRHHWGTDIDINSTTPADFSSGAGKKTYEWLAAHGASYGFCQPYSAKGVARPDGYNEEKWHWSYKPIAAEYLKRWPQDAGYTHITGFLGSETARDIDTIPKYIDGVNPACK
jgi:LAS superfamily LD-carboxypeptidase LdcB